MQSKVLSLGKNQPPKQLPVSKPVDEGKGGIFFILELLLSFIIIVNVVK